MDDHNTSDNIDSYIEKYKQEFNKNKIPPRIAKLYSQFSKMNMNQLGLISWSNEEATERFDEAIKLIYFGVQEKNKRNNEWKINFKIAGEILEWLSHPRVNIFNYPLYLLSAACYQIAGYPALALGLINERPREENESEIIRLLLKNDFRKIEQQLIDYWKQTNTKNIKNDLELFNTNTDEYVIREVLSIIGILFAYLKWGETDRLTLAINKMEEMSKLLLHDTNSLNWLLVKLISLMLNEIVENSLRKKGNPLLEYKNNSLVESIEKYYRRNFLHNKVQLWPSQIKGINKLLTEKSFVLCTPTGSGKTTIAELATLINLFSDLKTQKGYESFNLINLLENIEPIVLYLVPSRALATEIEWKLNNVLKDISNEAIKVTGLYGGTDWGPTDAWINQNEKTVLICTYEKAEALLRFMGPLFIPRISLVIIDEAHSVQFDENIESLVSGDNRTLRLESLSNRLINFLHDNNRSVVALSAVIGTGAQKLSDWITQTENSIPEESGYRSTRQLIGRLEYFKNGNFEIRYDLLNGSSLNFKTFNDSKTEDVPFIPSPFDTAPIELNNLPKRYIGKKMKFTKRSRPYLFWAAMQLAQNKENGKQSTVLISIAQHINGYATDFLHIIDRVFKDNTLPSFFNIPTVGYNKILWEKSLKVCADYYGETSIEYKLLKKGIIVHYGKMPSILSRMLIELINKKVIAIVIATSTLSEGINLPFDIVLIPTLARRGEKIPVSEFANLVGRAGRPGNGTEGKALIFLEAKSSYVGPGSWNARHYYEELINDYELLKNKERNNINTGISPLATLISYIEDKWRLITQSNSEEEFFDWLEKAIPSENEQIFEENSGMEAEQALDTLDSILIAAIVEIEQADDNMNLVRVEHMLTELWKKTYAYYSTSQQSLTQKVFVRRGVSLIEDIYPDSKKRRRFYKSSVEPRYAVQLIESYEQIISQLKTGFDYIKWNKEQRVEFLINNVKEINKLKKFTIKKGVGKDQAFVSWELILNWWLSPENATIKPQKNVAGWIKFINENFNYKYNWGIGTVLSLAFDEVYQGELVAFKIEDWEKTELPWIVFWIKELINWGTLDPVVAFIMSCNIEITRKEANEKAQKYYSEYYAMYEEIDDSIFDVRKIQKWTENHFTNTNKKTTLTQAKIPVKLLREIPKDSKEHWKVYPIEKENKIIWIDYSGYIFAESIGGINSDRNNDYILNSRNSTVKVQKYIMS
ncbi:MULTISPECIES: DEAD/DEAH box helicase [unclassified Priestia]|uniref:DEAD/DEAH box helicase n=1 Tax=unclassified Priestia TaxID=2800374 RepID=UPI00366F255F